MNPPDQILAWMDKSALAELVARLSAAVDRCDRQAIEACYSPESFDDHGSFRGSGREFAEMICDPAGPMGALRTHHLLGQSVFDLDGDQAWGETFFVMHAVFDGSVTRGLGRYIDYFRRLGSGWKIVYRRVVPDVTMAGDDVSAYWQSRSDDGDPRYDRLTGPPPR